MTNRDNFMKIVSDEKSDTISAIKKRVNNRDVLHIQQDYALKILVKIDELGINKNNFYQFIDLNQNETDLILRGKKKLNIILIEKINTFLNTNYIIDDVIVLDKCKKDDYLISKHGEILKYVKKLEDQYMDHEVIYYNKSPGSRTNDGFVFKKRRLNTDHDIIRIIYNNL